MTTKKKYTEQQLMEIAINVMNKSVNEPRDDGKVPPKVGAVILFPDGSIEKAYRGELREGDHAEYTLLERKLSHKNLEDCVLFTTLEPCVKRNLPKVPCCRRTTHARIKKVFVGIEDPDPTVDGKGIEHLESHGVNVKMFDRKFQKIIEAENKDFINQAIDRKRKSTKVIIPKNSFEDSLNNYDISKLSNKALNKFIKEANLNYQISDDSFLEYLSDFGALKWSESKKKYIPTGYGNLLFGGNPRAKQKNAVVKAYVDYGGGKIESKDFSDALVLIPDQIEDWLNKVLPLSKNTGQFKRKDVPDFPIEVLREAIINAIVHRDYNVVGAKNELKIYNDKIVVSSPGMPLPAISIDDLNLFNAPSLSRNPIITYVFSLMGFVEEKGFGMATFKAINKEFKLPTPQYYYNAPFLELTFARTTVGLKEIIDMASSYNLTDKEVRHFEIFRIQKFVTKSQFLEYTNLPERTAQRQLKKWVEEKLITKIGAGRSTKYSRKQLIAPN